MASVPKSEAVDYGFFRQLIMITKILLSVIPPVVDAIAQIKNKKEEDVADQLIKNFNRFFGTTLV